MKTLRFPAFFLALSIVFPCAAADEELIDSVVFDKQEALDLANAYLRAQFRAFPGREPPEVDWNKSYMSASRAQDGSEFIFVGFKSVGKDVGVSIVFEICKTTPFLTPSSAGAHAYFLESFEYFGSLSKNNAGGPDSPCPEPYE